MWRVVLLSHLSQDQRKVGCVETRHRCFLGYPERAPKIQVTFPPDRSFTNLNAYGGSDGPQGYPGTGCERFQQQIARTGHEPGTACGRMQSRLNKRLSSFNLACNSCPDSPLGPQGHECGFGTLAIMLLEWGLERSEFFCLHHAPLLSRCDAQL